MNHRTILPVLIPLLLASIPTASLPAGPADDAAWRERIGYNPLIHGGTKARVVSQPGEIPGLVVWLDAGSGVEADQQGRVTAWRDRSGRKHDVATSQAEDFRPVRLANLLVGQPVLRFEGDEHVGRGLTCGNVTLGRPDQAVEGMTVLVVASHRRETFASHVMLYDELGRDGHASILGPFDLNLGNDFGSKLSASHRAATGSGFKVLTARLDAAADVAELFVNAERVARGSVPFALKDHGPLTVGARNLGNHSHAGGICMDLAELLIFDRALSAEERLSAESYLLGKYGLSAASQGHPLATQLPYAWYPSTRRLDVAFDSVGFWDRAKVAPPQGWHEQPLVEVALRRKGDQAAVFKGTLKLTASGQGRGTLAVPELADGEYEVVYRLAGHTVVADRPLVHQNFPWVGNQLGADQKVYAGGHPGSGRLLAISDRTVL